jgi:hypothetical protein
MPRPAKACAIFTASEKVSAYEMFDVTDTVAPYSGKVMNDATIPPSDSPSCPIRLVGFTRQCDVSKSQTVARVLSRSQSL